MNGDVSPLCLIGGLMQSENRCDDKDDSPPAGNLGSGCEWIKSSLEGV